MNTHIAARQALVNKITALTEELAKAEEELAKLDAGFDVYAVLATMQSQIDALAQAVLSRPAVDPPKVVVAEPPKPEPEPEVVETIAAAPVETVEEDSEEEAPVSVEKAPPVKVSSPKAVKVAKKAPVLRNGVPKVKDAMIMVMGSATMTTGEVADAMLARNWLAGSKGPKAYVATVFSSHKDIFLNVGRGLYKIAPKYRVKDVVEAPVEKKPTADACTLQQLQRRPQVEKPAVDDGYLKDA